MSYVQGGSCGIGVQFIHYPPPQHDIYAGKFFFALSASTKYLFSVTVHIPFFRSVIIYGELL